MSKFLFICRNNYEEYLAGELKADNLDTYEIKGGMVLSRIAENIVPDSKYFCFPHFCMIDPVMIKENSVNALSDAIAKKFFNSNKQREINTIWPFLTVINPELTGLGKRESAVRNQTMEYLRRIAGRVSKLAVQKLPEEQGFYDGLFLYFEDFSKIYISSQFVWFGQKRVSDDDLAPSRSFMKIEEACHIMGMSPVEGQTVCDLGAAPGGWSYSAAKRGAKVTAIDNGELKVGAANNANIRRLEADAFKYEPERPFDWLFCDMVEHPNMVIKIIEKWITMGWCRFFIVNLKFGRVRPLELLDQLTGQSSIIKKRCLHLQIKHLFHDREEITVMGRLE